MLRVVITIIAAAFSFVACRSSIEDPSSSLTEIFQPCDHPPAVYTEVPVSGLVETKEWNLSFCRRANKKKDLEIYADQRKVSQISNCRDDGISVICANDSYQFKCTVTKTPECRLVLQKQNKLVELPQCFSIQTEGNTGIGCTSRHRPKPPVFDPNEWDGKIDETTGLPQLHLLLRNIKRLPTLSHPQKIKVVSLLEDSFAAVLFPLKNGQVYPRIREKFHCTVGRIKNESAIQLNIEAFSGTAKIVKVFELKTPEDIVGGGSFDKNLLMLETESQRLIVYNHSDSHIFDVTIADRYEPDSNLRSLYCEGAGKPYP